ncbi:hypothetical protein ACO34A_13880 [Rhizobium sp. ACO-34A]|nr:hypothetical protein [Rhizobium sp. ACO-34A]ATN34889.1 hypothetical protein ACO34A_13880 [Rhizobium sp. ACO-34A]
MGRENPTRSNQQASERWRGQRTGKQEGEREAAHLRPPNAPGKNDCGRTDCNKRQAFESNHRGDGNRHAGKHAACKAATQDAIDEEQEQKDLHVMMIDTARLEFRYRRCGNNDDRNELL